MRIATWNLDARWTAKHAAFLHDQAADVWCLTEVPPRAIVGGRIVGYTAVGSTGRMSRGQHYAVVAARVAPTDARCPHPATVVADVDGIAVGAMGLVAATAALPHRRPGSFAIDHIAIPVSWRVVAAHRIVADGLSDHDAYVVDAEPSL
jgi:hypothetical protein